MYVVLSLLSAIAVGLLLDRLHVPGGMMVGAVIGACALNLISGGLADLPPVAKTAAQIVAGAFIGAGVRREDLKKMRSILSTTAIVVFFLFLVNVVSGLIIYWISPLDPLTALMATVPGGISEIPIIAVEMGADATPVLTLQLVRLVMGIAIFPSIIAKIPQEEHYEEEKGEYRRPAGDLFNTVLTLAVGTAFGLLGRVSGVPGGTMAFASLGTVGFKLLYPKACVIIPVRKVAQCLSGTYVGVGIGWAQLVALQHLVMPALVLLVCYTLGALVISTVLRRRGVFNLRESLLAATPAGASDMALISADLGVHNVQIILLQVMRFIAVIVLFPTLLQVIASLLTP
ncbi:MAG: hypothetical protein GX910_04655 [Clostridiaceae bacterium]|nr:hypothetical protein [Clostridiaceae bacterium]